MRRSATNTGGIKHAPRGEWLFARFLQELAGHLFLGRASGESAAFMRMGTNPTTERPLNGRWPIKCASFDELLVDVAAIMVNAARQPESSSLSFAATPRRKDGTKSDGQVMAGAQTLSGRILPTLLPSRKVAKVNSCPVLVTKSF